MITLGKYKLKVVAVICLLWRNNLHGFQRNLKNNQWECKMKELYEIKNITDKFIKKAEKFISNQKRINHVSI